MRIREFASGFLGALVMSAAWSPSQAYACSCSPSPIFKHDTDPKDGAMDVPVNKAVVFEGMFKAGTVTIEDGLGQRMDDVTINEGPAAGGCPARWAEIIPNQSWGPRTTYIIRVQALYSTRATPEESSLSFVTGADSLPEPELTVPKARASLLTNLPESGACGVLKVKTCLTVEGQTEERRDVEVIARRGDQVLLRTLMSINDADYGFAEIPDCLELRRRSPTGKRSKPLTLCGDALPANPLQPQSSNWSDWPTCKDGAYLQKAAPTAGGNGASGQSAGTDTAGTGGLDEPATGMEVAGAPPSAAGDKAGSTDDADDEEESTHREYGCAAAPGRPANASVGWLTLVTLAIGSFMRRRVRQR